MSVTKTNKKRTLERQTEHIKEHLSPNNEPRIVQNQPGGEANFIGAVTLALQDL